MTWFGEAGTPVRAKICGIRSEDDLRIAINSGADAVGFISGVTHFSEDELTAEEAQSLCRQVPPFVSRVLVTHLDDHAEIIHLARSIGVDSIQVHGLVTEETAARVFENWNGTVTRVLHMVSGIGVEDALRVASTCDAVQFDSRTEDRLGGTGMTHDWNASASIALALREREIPTVLSGGLNDQNVAEAIDVVRPFAVDVNSGVEGPEGDKSSKRVNAFVEAAHGAG